ncbi:lysine transporter [Corynebacterium bovis]|uniref:Arginine:ornithine antiporter/lysine permease n=1 Tax=Corynebacterium bovis DSM 20582 = CIP 54.80 TaxID=927655 RepID=A0A8H9YCK7_9CORY|nr:arginine:ornithine antiporter/lysine permease [Corynebacterium bovis DSM 20582 = CIP 54.80]QQC46723.1 amino acid permease [Corynebacterium bovis]RRO80484.1 lysine transporter [Corynebacterium bovis]RRO83242.1 lysine transporter [Corynebacterium bovis]RRO83879.1 lysine transporter [Corynebacterium bovis]
MSSADSGDSPALVDAAGAGAGPGAGAGAGSGASGSGSTATAAARTVGTVRLGTLVSLIVGSCVGAGIFALPQNIAGAAGPGAAAVGWLVTGVGMLCVAFVFQALAHRKPHLDSGVYAYVRAGLGDFVGFSSAWGYWLGTIIAQVGYATLFFSSLGFFVPVFDGDHPLVQSLAVSALTWGIFLILSRGVHQAAILNVVTTVSKILPILVFLGVVVLVGFHTEYFTADVWGRAATFGAGGDEARSFTDQVKGTMLFTVWTFIGVEGASTYSRRARSRRDVSVATFLGFLVVFALLVAVSLLSYGVVPREELAAMGDNSMAEVLRAVVGPWGAGLISAGLCISVLGAYVSWQMLCAEPVTLMAQDGLLPRVVGRTNRAGSPVAAQFISALVIQVFIVVFYLNQATYTTMVQLATSLYLVPYVFSSLYLLFLCTRGEGIQHPDAGRKFDLSGPAVPAGTNRVHLVLGAVGFLYSLWLIYAADLRFVLLGTLLMLPGAVVYTLTRLAAGGRVFNRFEWVVVTVIVGAAVVALALLLTGNLSL